MGVTFGCNQKWCVLALILQDHLAHLDSSPKQLCLNPE
ncbi:hypothetical protein nACB1_069 [Acinetobacter phage nACB1]|nr:hypothetical protein nACB1_069 [Acinetobacter phage nACB1]